MKDGGDIYGTGVNVAVRLEGLADHGGILISEHAYQQVHDKLEIDLRDRGPQTLKNIDEPVRAYAIYIDTAQSAPSDAPKPKSPPRWRAVAAALVVAAVIGGLAWQSTRPPPVEAAVVADMAYPLPDKPSIAVLAFENLSTADDELLADSFSEDILTSLSKLSGLFVISRTTTFTYKGINATAKQIAEDLGIRYVLEGSIQRDGDRIRVNVQLIDAIGGQHVWADRYDRDLDDLFAVKDDITLNIISNIRAELLRGERDRLSRSGTGSLQAWLLYRQGIAAKEEVNQTSLNSAKDLLEQAIAIDPEFVPAIVGLAGTYSTLASWGWVDPAIALPKSEELINTARTIEPTNPQMLTALGDLLLARSEFDAALESYRAAIERAPSDDYAHYRLGWALYLAGEPDESVFETLTAMRLSPVFLPVVANVLGAGMYLKGDLEGALAVFEEQLDPPRPPQGYRGLPTGNWLWCSRI